ncbi:hypothetical protein [Streptomyces sp. NPDC056160]|uniref:hypothetical protein n=1 Tax=Streptomyces sp. NPDC056160 TaxID=3345731 RepID=UPI0035D5878A
MTATMHIGRRTTPHQPLTGLRTWWAGFQLRHSRRALDSYMERARLARPVTDPHRHAWDNPALEEAFARLAADHPEAVTPADGGLVALDADREQLLLAVCDRWFHEAHPGPEHRWHPMTIATHAKLMDGVRACFHSGGAA